MKCSSGSEVAWDEESKKKHDSIRIACLPCAKKQVAAGKGEFRPKTETPARSAGASGLVASTGGNNEIISLLTEIRDLHKSNNAMLKKLMLERGLEIEEQSDFSPPEQFPDLAVFGDTKPTHEYSTYLDWVNENHEELARFLGEHCKSFSYEDSTANIGITSQFVSYAEKNRKLLSSYFPAKTQVNFVPVNR